MPCGKKRKRQKMATHKRKKKTKVIPWVAASEKGRANPELELWEDRRSEVKWLESHGRNSETLVAEDHRVK